MALILSFLELERFWRPVKHLGTLSANLLFLAIFATLVFVLNHQKFLFVPPDHFEEVLDLECGVQLSGKKQANLVNQTTNESFEFMNFPSLDSLISLEKYEIYKSLTFATSLDDVN